MSLAASPGALTGEWLTEVLAGQGDLAGARVEAVAQASLGSGQMCDSLRLELTWDRPPPEWAPASLVAKLPAADEVSRSTAMSLRSYEIEVRFYQELAPELPVRTPQVHHADIDTATGDFVLLLEDLTPARQGDQLAGCSPEQAAAAVDELVRLHAPRWGDPALAGFEWLHRDPDASRTFLLGLLPGLWDGFRARYEDRLGAEVHEAGDVLFGRLERYLAEDTGPWTVVHGDYRLDNLLFGGTDPVAVVDWQTCGHGRALNDVAYFLGAGLLPEDRRSHEHDLVRRYHRGLVAAGVTGYDWDRCWADHRRGTWSGLVMAVAASMLVERTERGDGMFMAMAHRHARHALDLRAADLLG